MITTRRSRRGSSQLLVLVALVGCLIPLPMAEVSAQATEEVVLTRIEGTLANGTPWEIVVPSGWNGTLLLDLDFETSQSRYEPLYERGFAGGGIRRSGAGDAQAIAADLISVLDIFTEEFGEPEYVLGNGRSRGGVASVVLMETYPDRIDGSVSQCTVPGYIPSYNSKLDAAFAAQQLLGTDLAIVDIPTGSAEFNALVNGWRDVLTAAQGTPEGQARIALAHALGQLPTWSDPDEPKPDPKDSSAVQQSMFNTLLGQFYPAGGSRLGVRRQYEQASGGVWNWNTGVDYVEIFNQMVRPEHKTLVQEFYRRAGLDLSAELEALNAAPRISADPAAVAEMQRRGGHTADPERPVLFNQAIGDPTTQVVTIDSYVDRARRNGKGALVRTTFVDTAGHCAFSSAAYVAVVEVLDERVRTGRWPSTAPHHMNERVRSIDETAAPDFVQYRIEEFARPFFLGDVYP